MRLNIFISALWLRALAAAYYAMFSYAPLHPGVHEKTINAHHKVFSIGAKTPTTFCGLDDIEQCPDANETLVDAEMTRLAAAVPGGQSIYIAPNGLISYPSAHSSHRPPGSEMGGFFSFQLRSECIPNITVLSWQSLSGRTGLWACPSPSGVPMSEMSVLKASSADFTGRGCLRLEGVRIQEAGDEFGAWAYT